MTALDLFGRRPETIVQMAYVAHDLEAAALHWSSLGAGPFFHSEVFVPDGLYRGVRGPLRYRAAFGYLSGMNIEIISPADDAPSVYREVLDTHGPGFHHYMLRTEDYKATLAHFAAQGICAAYEAELPGSGPWAYLDARSHIGSFVEVYEMTLPIAAAWRAMLIAHEAWQGDKPLRSYDELPNFGAGS